MIRSVCAVLSLVSLCLTSVWVAAEEPPKLKDAEFEVATLSPDGFKIVTGDYGEDSFDPALPATVWDVKSGRKLFSLHRGDWSVRMAFSPTGALLTVWGGSNYGDDRSFGRFQIWDVAKGVARVDLKVNDRYFTSAAFSPDEKLLALGAMAFDHLDHNASYEVRLWDVVKGREVARLKAEIQALALTPDGKTLIAGGLYSHGKVHLVGPPHAGVGLWDVASRKLKKKIDLGYIGNVAALAVSPCGKYLAVGGSDCRFELWDLETHKRKQLIYKRGTIQPFAFSPDGRWLAFSPDKRGKEKIVLWDVAAGKEVTQFKGTDNGIATITFSPDGKQLIAGSASELVPFSRIDLAETKEAELKRWDLSEFAAKQ